MRMLACLGVDVHVSHCVLGGMDPRGRATTSLTFIIHHGCESADFGSGGSRLGDWVARIPALVPLGVSSAVVSTAP